MGRHSLRRVAALAVWAASVVGIGWAAVGTAPPVADALGDLPEASADAIDAANALAAQAAGTVTGPSGPQGPGAPPDLSVLRPLPAGQFLVGAAISSIAPDPAQWRTEGCSQLLSNFPDEVTHLADLVLAGELPGWPRSPDCIYLGGYGIGPARAATSVDPFSGVNVRSVAISNGTDTIVWQTIDTVGWFNVYRDDVCDGCGLLGMRRRIAEGAGLPVANIGIGSTHTHGGADGYGAWGGLPRWYREQVADTVVRSAYDAMRAMRPAAILVGSVDMPDFNNERRDTYRSVSDYGAAWLQAVALGRGGHTHRSNTIVTLVNFAAHPVILGDQPVMHGDWPATASSALANRFGGVGIIVEGGLGNVSPRLPVRTDIDLTGDGTVDDYDEVIEMGERFADAVSADIVTGGHRLEQNEIGAAETSIEHPATNWLEVLLGNTGLLDRAFLPGEAAGAAGSYLWSDGDSPPALARPCSTAAPNTIITQVSAWRIGELAVASGPGELFSSITNVVKAQGNRSHPGSGGVVMVFSQFQDSLGYIIPSYEVDPMGGATSNVDVGEYEETFMVDRCFGDHVLDTQLSLLRSLD